MKAMTFADVERAVLPAARMGRLASLRCQPGVEVALHERHLWLRWPAGNEAIAGLVFAIGEAHLYARVDGYWYAWNRATPDFAVPQDLRFRPLDQVIFPERIEPTAAVAPAVTPVALRLVADDCFRPTMGLLCPLASFWQWAESMPPSALVRLRAAFDGQRLFVLGKQMPIVDGGERFWGQRVFIPLGFRPEPDLSEASLRKLLDVPEEDLVVLRPESRETIAQDLFTPLGHAALRLLLRRESTP